MKYWKNTAHNLVAIGKETNSIIKNSYLFLFLNFCKNNWSDTCVSADTIMHDIIITDVIMEDDIT
jgi:hypothetical protein